MTQALYFLSCPHDVLRVLEGNSRTRTLLLQHVIRQRYREGRDCQMGVGLCDLRKGGTGPNTQISHNFLGIQSFPHSEFFICHCTLLSCLARGHPVEGCPHLLSDERTEMVIVQRERGGRRDAISNQTFLLQSLEHRDCASACGCEHLEHLRLILVNQRGALLRVVALHVEAVACSLGGRLGAVGRCHNSGPVSIGRRRNAPVCEYEIPCPGLSDLLHRGGVQLVVGPPPSGSVEGN
mmetsp:Transcript_33028/g.65464  ORF Transcript_33028/g.65464 Transcript_33028/m.65464 type:complete len:237 (-) Transcript_33028:1217-1927(-)